MLLIHRPKYDDWSFPKGKLMPGEQAQVAAAREVREETGVRIRLGLPLPTVRYPLASGDEKVVSYWAARQVAPDRVPAFEPADFTPNDEVDRSGWFGLRAAADRLTHVHDRDLLATLPLLDTRPLVVLRHAGALPRQEWADDDLDRPLDPAGAAQAERLVPVLDAYGLTRLVSSPARRCLDTLLPYATRFGLAIETDDTFAEGTDPDDVRAHAVRLLESPEPTALCTHRPTLPTVFEALGIAPRFLQPAELIVAHVAVPDSDRTPLAVEHVAAPPAVH